MVSPELPFSSQPPSSARGAYFQEHDLLSGPSWPVHVVRLIILLNAWRGHHVFCLDLQNAKMPSVNYLNRELMTQNHDRVFILGDFNVRVKLLPKNSYSLLNVLILFSQRSNASGLTFILRFLSTHFKCLCFSFVRCMASSLCSCTNCFCAPSHPQLNCRSSVFCCIQPRRPPAKLNPPPCH